MRKVLALIVISAVLLFAGCAFVPDVTYTEANDATNDMAAENAGSLASGTLLIKGTISSAGDVDLYKVAVGSVTSIHFDTIYNGKSMRSRFSFFPFGFITYNATGTILGIHPGMAWLSSWDLDAGTSYIVFEFSGTFEYASGNYELRLQ